MAELKTKETTASVSAFLNAIPDKQRRADARAVADMMKGVTKATPKMWGTSIVGYGSQHYRYASGREGDWFRTGFSLKKDALTLYITSSFERYPDLMAKLGKYRTGKSCLHIKRLTDVDMKVLKQLIARSLKRPLPGA
ncbi:MAG: DUF1801 domain-containing protein [Vicinamibacterales bacterium]